MVQVDKAKMAVKNALRLITAEMEAAAVDLLGTGVPARWASRWDTDGPSPKLCVFECEKHTVTAKASDDGASLIIEDDGHSQRLVYSEEKGAFVRESLPSDALSDPARLVHELIYARARRVPE